MPAKTSSASFLCNGRPRAHVLQSDLAFSEPTAAAWLTCAVGETGFVELSHVELQANDGEHKDGEEEKQANL